MGRASRNKRPRKRGDKGPNQRRQALVVLLRKRNKDLEAELAACKGVDDGE